MNVSYQEEFTKNGFVVLKQLFTGEEALQLKEETAKILSKQIVHKSGVFLGLASESAAFKEAAVKPLLVNVLKEIIGDHVIFMNDKIVFKNVSTDFGSPWHQDYPYWNGSHKISVWIALDDANKENGCLKVIPGSHASVLRHAGDVIDDTGFVNRIADEDIDPSRIVDLPASAGDAIVFHDLLLHSSYPNISGSDRWAVISTYKDGTLEDPKYSWAKAAFTI